jgi:hypothetical protein
LQLGKHVSQINAGECDLDFRRSDCHLHGLSAYYRAFG